jgi:hypothetical protein
MFSFLSRKKRENEFLLIERKFEKFFWETLPPLDNFHIYLLPEEAKALGLDKGSDFIKINTRYKTDSVFESIQVGNLTQEQLVFKPIRQLELFINNSDIILRKLVY